MAKYNGCDLDVDLASEVQQLLFPKGSPVCDWYCLWVRNHMARGFGICNPEDDCTTIVMDLHGPHVGS